MGDLGLRGHNAAAFRLQLRCGFGRPSCVVTLNQDDLVSSLRDHLPKLRLAFSEVINTVVCAAFGKDTFTIDLLVGFAAPCESS